MDSNATAKSDFWAEQAADQKETEEIHPSSYFFHGHPKSRMTAAAK